MGAEYPFDTTRKAAHIAEAIRRLGDGDQRLVPPPQWAIDAAVEGIDALHDADYVSALRTGGDRFLAESQGLGWDPGIWPMAVHSTAGVIAATDAALADGVAGSLSSGLHHARSDGGAGYCTVNGLVVAAHHRLAEPGDVAILDLDAHCGGGTAEMLATHDLRARVRHYDLATSAFDVYEPTHADDHFALVPDNDDDYLGAVEQVLDLMPWSQLRIVLYNAGVDPHPAISRLALEIRERLVFERAAREGVPIAWVLAGGYTYGIDMDALVGLHLLTVDGARRAQR